MRRFAYDHPVASFVLKCAAMGLAVACAFALLAWVFAPDGQDPLYLVDLVAT